MFVVSPQFPPFLFSCLRFLNSTDPTISEPGTGYNSCSKIEGKIAGCSSACEVKLDQVLLVMIEPVSIALLILMLVVLYFVVNIYLARFASERAFIPGGRVDRQQPNDEAVDRRNNVAVNGNRALPQEHEGWPPWVGKWHFIYSSFF